MRVIVPCKGSEHLTLAQLAEFRDAVAKIGGELVFSCRTDCPCAELESVSLTAADIGVMDGDSLSLRTDGIDPLECR